MTAPEANSLAESATTPRDHNSPHAARQSIKSSTSASETLAQTDTEDLEAGHLPASARNYSELVHVMTQNDSAYRMTNLFHGLAGRVVNRHERCISKLEQEIDVAEKNESPEIEALYATAYNHMSAHYKFVWHWSRVHNLEKPNGGVVNKWFYHLKRLLPDDEASYLADSILHQVAIAPTTGLDHLWRSAVENTSLSSFGNFLFRPFREDMPELPELTGPGVEVYSSSAIDMMQWVLFNCVVTVFACVPPILIQKFSSKEIMTAEVISYTVSVLIVCILASMMLRDKAQVLAVTLAYGALISNNVKN